MKGIILNDLKKAYLDLLDAVIEYAEYEHSGDPWEEDSRAMGEMTIDNMKTDGRLDKYKQIAKRIKN